MQYKGLLLSALLALSVSALQAQQTKSITMQAPARVIKMDTVMPSAAHRSNKGLIAGNLPDQCANSTPVPFTGVPLAGQKSYFGPMTEYVNGFCRSYLGAHKSTLSVVQDRSNNKFSLIDNVLTKNNVPKELKYLAVIESALNNKAISRVGAVGPWQLMDATARMMGLSVNKKRDDRTDWFKSTNGAAKYLNQLYGQLNDWLLVVAAYNSGPTPVLRAIQLTGSHNFWDIKKYLPRETQGHVLAFIATASIFEKMSNFIGMGALPMDFKFGNEELAAAADVAKTITAPKLVFTQEELNNMAIVRISEPISLELLASELGIEHKLLQKWNPDYDLFVYATYSDDFYRLRIPKDKLDGFVEKKEQLTKRSKKIFSDETQN